MAKIFKLFLSEIQKTQTRCGGVLFLASLIFWFIILIFIAGYTYQQEANQFHCQTLGNHIQLNRTLNSKCYREYSETYNNPNFGRFALVNGLALLISWACYLICAFGCLPHDSHMEENPRRPDPSLMRFYITQLCLRTLYLVVMMALTLGMIPSEFPLSFKCILGEKHYLCFDELSLEKTTSRKAVLVYDGLFGLLTFWELFYVLCR